MLWLIEKKSNTIADFKVFTNIISLHKCYIISFFYLAFHCWTWYCIKKIFFTYRQLTCKVEKSGKCKRALTQKIFYALKKTRLKITQLEKVHFIKVNELKLNQVELFSFFHFVCFATNSFELFCMTHLADIELFLYHSNLSF